MKYYVIVGEASGDLHASKLIRELKLLDPAAEFRAWGGELMEKEGADIVADYRDTAFMGFFDVIVHLRTILKNIKRCKEDIKSWKPDVVILVDYPGFNLRIAKAVKAMGIKTFYYISPQLWAWKAGRIKQVKAFVDRMYVILPFEQEWYKERGVDVDFVGHPLMDAVYEYHADEHFNENNNIKEQKVLALLPGSRAQEIKRILPVMIKAAQTQTGMKVLLSKSPSLDSEYYDSYLKGTEVELVKGHTYDLLKNADLALVTSGTATLEVALFKVPEVICYKADPLSFMIGKQVVKVPFISLVNLIMGKEIVQELIQGDCSVDNLKREMARLVGDKPYFQALSDNYDLLEGKLGGAGASARAASLMFQRLHIQK